MAGRVREPLVEQLDPTRFRVTLREEDVDVQDAWHPSIVSLARLRRHFELRRRALRYEARQLILAKTEVGGWLSAEKKRLVHMRAICFQSPQDEWRWRAGFSFRFRDRGTAALFKLTYI